jgi:hypothetical protein
MTTSKWSPPESPLPEVSRLFQDVYDKLNQLRGGVPTDTEGNVVSIEKSISAYDKALATKYTDFSTTVEFTATDYDTVTWTAGTITYDDGRIFSIDSGTTGNFTDKVYIYFVPEDRVSLLYVTAMVSPVRFKTIKVRDKDNEGKGWVTKQVVDQVTYTKMCMCIASSNSSEKAAVIPALGVIKVGRLSAISASLGEVDAGIFRSGQSAYNTGTGFWLGTVGATPKLSLGNPAGDYLLWDGTNLQINGTMSITGAVNWSDIVDDGHKPDDDATAGATWGLIL